MLHKLPNVFFSLAIIFRGDVGQLRLEFGAEIYFHDISVGAEIGTAKRERCSRR
jgi:hypothetical protein